MPAIRTHTAEVDVEAQDCPICGSEHDPVTVENHIAAAKAAKRQYGVYI